MLVYPTAAVAHPSARGKSRSDPQEALKYKSSRGEGEANQFDIPPLESLDRLLCALTVALQ